MSKITEEALNAFKEIAERLLRSNTAISDSQLTYEGKLKTK